MEFSPQHRKTSARGGCCVSSCTSKRSINTNLSFHRVPKYGAAKISRINLFGNTEIVDKRKEWLRVLKVSENNKDLFVCSLHFNADDYYFPDVHAKVRILKKNSIPIPILPINTSRLKKERNADRKKRMEQRLLKKDSKNNNKQKPNRKEISDKSSTENSSDLNIAGSSLCDKKQEHCDFLQKGKLQQNVVDSHLYEMELEQHDADCENHIDEKIHCEPEPSFVLDYFANASTNANYLKEDHNSEQKAFKDIAVQVTSGDFSISFCSFIKSEKSLITMCNISSFAILNELTRLIDEVYPKKKKTLLNTRESIILTTAKLKLDISFSALAVLFNEINTVTIRNIFYDTVKKLATILQSVITRVSKEEIQQNMPKCFNKFQTTTSVLDCTEIKIQKPKCLKCRIKFYSHYKGDLTVKFMTEVTPAGMIISTSEAFGGRASDKCIFNYSGVLNYLESTRDSVMVDKGFLIDDECLQKRIQLIRPPFLRNQQQLTERDALENRDIACARVHIERMNQRIKQFRILNNKYPWHLINYIDDIFLICCALANLASPILADDKF